MRIPRSLISCAMAFRAVEPDNQLPREYKRRETRCAVVAQLVERLICNQDVTGSIPVGGTIKSGVRLLKD